ncbi:olfactory receptor 6B1-like [Alligator mississippiensis]|uniref:olfactory receptor 6B1-like n=1 Tax=Alligator mississippiensis TaxID=8496 RepID=UPI002877E149|nr:olfactory receptor 6B1-like [Alligator mississippiensis]
MAMETENATVATYFIILGFPSLQKLQLLFFFVVLTIYLLTLAGHILIIILVHIDSCLHTPMYFYLSNFSFLEIWYTSNIIPKMLKVFLGNDRSITYTGCITQLYFFMSLVTAECFILAIMACDRYLAICHPLQYPTLMNNRVCLRLALCSWVGSFLVIIPPLISLCKLSFCGPNEINHFFCDVSPLLKLSCVDPHEAETVDFVVATSVLVSSIVPVVVSYALIIVTILKMPSATGRQKAFSTCGSHLVVVSVFFGTLIYMYARPASLDSADFSKVLSVFYTVVTPMLNPVIYCLRNKEVKEALRRAVKCSHALLGSFFSRVLPLS